MTDAVDTVDDGLEAGLGGGFRRLATRGLTGGAGEDSELGGGGGGRAPGGLGADATGGFGGGRAPSVSERYGESRLAPVSTPPRLRSLGIPPAKSPPSWGAAGSAVPLSPPDPVSLLLRSRLAACPGGTGGASPPGGGGGFAMPGTGGAAPNGGPEDLTPPPAIIGADLSLVTVFFNLVPLLISERRALRPFTSLFPGMEGKDPGGGGGGGPPIPPGGGGGGGGGGIVLSVQMG